MVTQTPQVAREVLGGREALLRLLREAALDDPAHGSGHAGVRLPDRHRLLTDDCGQRLGPGVPLERALARRELVEDRAE